MCGETLDSTVSISNGNIKCPIEKSIFVVNLKLKVFRAIVAYADIGSLSLSIHSLKKCLFHMLVEFEQNRTVQTTRNFDLFDKALTPFWKTFL